MNIKVAFPSIAVADYPAARMWYERLMGRKPDMVPNDIEVSWQLKDNAWMYVIKDAERAGKALLTLIVDDLDSHIDEFKARGITVDFMEQAPNYRKANFVDPEGNTLAFVELFDEQP